MYYERDLTAIFSKLVIELRVTDINNSMAINMQTKMTGGYKKETLHTGGYRWTR